MGNGGIGARSHVVGRRAGHTGKEDVTAVEAGQIRWRTARSGGGRADSVKDNFVGDGGSVSMKSGRQSIEGYTHGSR